MEPSFTVVKDKKDAENTSSKPKSFGFGASNPDYLKNCLQDSKRTKTTNETNDYDPTSSLESPNEILSSVNECPYNGYTCPNVCSVLPLKRRYNHNNGLCGVHQITEPCLNSKRKYDYDLCNICSEEMGQDVDIRIDLPVIARRFSSLNGFHDHVNLITPRVWNDKNHADVINTEMDHDNELCENKFFGVMEHKELFFDAQPHIAQVTNILINDTSKTSNGNVLKSNFETAPKAL